MYIPNPSKPSDLSDIERPLIELIGLMRNGCWDLAKLDKWLQQHPAQMLQAVQRLDAHLDIIYPPENT